MKQRTITGVIFAALFTAFFLPAFWFPITAVLMSVVVGSFVRIAPYRYRLVGGAPLRYSEEYGKEGFTQLLNDRLGAAIRRYPEQYLWSHRRWR